LRLARQIDALTRDTVRELGLDDTLGSLARIPVAVNADSLSTWVLHVLADFTAEASFDFHIDDQDHTTDLLRDGSVMAAITSAAAPVQGCTSSRLGILRYRPMASAQFCDRWFADGVTAEALSVAPVVVFNRKDLLQDRYLDRKVGYPVDPPRHQVPSSAGFSDAVRLGYGWGLLPDLQSLESADTLVGFDPDSVYDVPLFWQQWKLSPPILVRIAEAVAARAQEILPQSTA
jgi:LysR family transcriptional regulator (chromosome initiation inhibitor)